MAAFLRQMAHRLGANNGSVVRVGFLEGSTAPDGQSMPLRAALNEYGVPSRNQPPRPFFRNMISAKSPTWGAAIAQNLKATGYDANATLTRMGMGIKGQLQTSILDLMSPALSPVTIAKKGFDKPLIEHGDMLNAVDFEVNSNS